MKRIVTLVAALALLTACSQQQEHKVVVCIPVYGQSYALGEEAERLTDFDSLANYAGGRIVTEKLDHSFGYFDNDNLKQFAKKLVHYQKRAFELSIYGMAEKLADNTGEDTLICIFPGGQGATAIANLSKGTPPYQKFTDDIKTAYEAATANGWDFVIPAICWMQGESDIADYPDTNYRQMLTQFMADINADIRQLTHQQREIPFICYQPNTLSRAERFKADNYDCPETATPEAMMELVRDDQRFWASGPTYPYTCVREALHIDGTGQRSIGSLAAKTALDIMHGAPHFQGLVPTSLAHHGNEVVVGFSVPVPPLAIDTTQVAKASHYGFSVVSRDNRDIASTVTIEGDSVRIGCTESPEGCKVRYAVNGEYMKSGNRKGPRGNLRDSQGDSLSITIAGQRRPLHNWCYQFDIQL